MKKLGYSFIIFILVFFPLVSKIFASSINGIDINLDVNSCNNNGVCEQGLENFLSCPADCKPSTGGGGGGSGSTPTSENFFMNLSVEPSYTSAIIRWTSFIPTIYVIKWGQNPDYKDGVLRNIHFTNNHEVEITNLESDTLYYFSIEAEGYAGQKSTIDNQTFRTLVPQDTTAPENPTNVVAKSILSGITLSWVNPPDKDFDYIRVIRSTEKYLSDPYSGKLIYEGSGQYARDPNVEKGVKYYYTLFARDKSGNWSSGSMVSITYTPPEGGQPEEPTKPTPEPEIDVPLTPIPELSYEVVQSGLKQDFELGQTVFLDGSKLSIVIANFSEQKFPDDMWIEIRDQDKVVAGRYFFSNKGGEYRSEEVIVPPIKGNGYYSVSVYRYNDDLPQLIHQGGFDITTLPEDERPSFPWALLIIITVSFLLIILLFWFVFRKLLPIIFARKKRKEEEERLKKEELEKRKKVSEIMHSQGQVDNPDWWGRY